MSDEKKEEKFDYSATLNLPKTDFPMRANLPQNEFLGKYPWFLTKKIQISMKQFHHEDEIH